MTAQEWYNLKTGDKIKHIRGDIETIYVSIIDGTQYIEGEKSLFPLTEFDYEEWEILPKEQVQKIEKEDK